MTPATTTCVTCDAPIQQFTADRHGGQCMPCHRAAAAIPPGDFEMPRELVERIATFHEVPAHYRQLESPAGRIV